MRSFKINPPEYSDPEPTAHWVEPGTHIIFFANQFTESQAEPLQLAFA